MAIKDSYADLERVKREISGAQTDLTRVFDNMSRSPSNTPSSTIQHYDSYKPPSYTPAPDFHHSPRNTNPIKDYSSYNNPISTPSQPYTPSSYPSNQPPISSAQPSYAPIVISPSSNTQPMTSGPSYIPSSSSQPLTSQGSVRVISNISNPSTGTYGTLGNVQTGYSSGPNSGGGDIQEVIFNTIEDYINRKSTLSSSDRHSISKLLLPSDVNLLYTQEADIAAEFGRNLQKEKETVEQEFDNFLKEIIQMMDKLKEGLFQKIDNHGVNFNAYYKQFVNKVGDFLNKSISSIQK